jgi:hypothetical protein
MGRTRDALNEAIDHAFRALDIRPPTPEQVIKVRGFENTSDRDESRDDPRRRGSEQR